MHRVCLIFCHELVADTFVNPPMSESISNGILLFNSRKPNGALESSATADPDLGPYCYLNVTSGNLTTGFFASSGFMITNAVCRTSCTQAGCSGVRESPFGSDVYSPMSQCAVAEAFHYAVAGVQKESKCPYVDMNVSKFPFRGTQYLLQWYWLGWPTMGDCMNAILCGPTSVYFDASQISTLKWCQPTPYGFYSPQCSNQLRPCNPPRNFADMSLGYWTSHGFGKPDGCGSKMIALAAISGIDISPIHTSTFTILASITTVTPSSIHPYPSWTILFGTLLSFFVGIRLTTPSTAIISFFHASLTVGPFDTWIETPELPWEYSEPMQLAISNDGISVSIFIDSVLVLTVPSTTTNSYSIGTLSPSSLVPSNWSSLVHVGPIFVTSPQFQAVTTGGINPYDFWTRDSTLDFAVANIRVVPQVFTTTTIPPIVTTTTTPLIVSTFTMPTTTPGESLHSTPSTLSTATTSYSTTTVSVKTESTTLIVTATSEWSTMISPSKTQSGVTANTSPGVIALITVASVFSAGLVGFLVWRWLTSRIKRRRSESIEVPLTGWHFNDITVLSTDLNNSMWRHP